MKLLICLLLALSGPVMLKAQVWTDIQNLKINFTIKNAGIKVEGGFSDISAKVNFDEKNISRSSFEGVIKTNSIQTGQSLRDDHLRNKSEFFNVKKFPIITMKSLSVGSTQTGGSFKVDWLITMKGISKKITTDVLVHSLGNSLYMLTVFKINRRDWKVGSNSLFMSDDVVVTLSGNLLN